MQEKLERVERRQIFNFPFVFILEAVLGYWRFQFAGRKTLFGTR